jgi:ABC-type polysaccharide/polyol phosphate export permease
VLINPLVYASEGLRGTLTESDHINTMVVIAALAAINVALLVVGLKKFHSKAVS